METFEAPKKPGYVVGFKLVELNEDGHKVSKHEHEWYGWGRHDANKFATTLHESAAKEVEAYRKNAAEEDGVDPELGALETT